MPATVDHWVPLVLRPSVHRLKCAGPQLGCSFVSSPLVDSPSRYTLHAVSRGLVEHKTLSAPSQHPKLKSTHLQTTTRVLLAGCVRVALAALNAESAGRSSSCRDPALRRPAHHLRWLVSSPRRAHRLTARLPRAQASPMAIPRLTPRRPMGRHRAVAPIVGVERANRSVPTRRASMATCQQQGRAARKAPPWHRALPPRVRRSHRGRQRLTAMACPLTLPPPRRPRRPRSRKSRRTCARRCGRPWLTTPSKRSMRASFKCYCCLCCRWC